MKPLRKRINKKKYIIMLKDEYISLLDLPHRGPHMAYAFEGSDMFVVEYGDKKVAALKEWCESFKADSCFPSRVKSE